MARFGYRTGKKTQFGFFLIFSRDPIAVRLTAGEPALRRNERALFLDVALPDALFDTPTLRAKLEVEHPEQAMSIDLAAAAEAVRQAVGMDVEISVKAPE